MAAEVAAPPARPGLTHKRLIDLIKTHRAVVLTKSKCSWCDKAAALLYSRQLETSDQVAYINIDALGDDGLDMYLDAKAATGQSTVPNVWMLGNHVGGYTKLVEWFQRFDGWLNALAATEGPLVAAAPDDDDVDEFPALPPADATAGVGGMPYGAADTAPESVSWPLDDGAAPKRPRLDSVHDRSAEAADRDGEAEAKDGEVGDGVA